MMISDFSLYPPPAPQLDPGPAENEKYSNNYYSNIQVNISQNWHSYLEIVFLQISDLK